MGRPCKGQSTSNMKVTSIRLEEELINELKKQKHPEGYQFLIRKVLWNYVRRSANKSKYDSTHIEGYMNGFAQMEQTCVLTGKYIAKGEACQFGITIDGSLVPVAITE